MFQSFDVTSNKSATAKRLEDLRKEMRAEKLDFFLVPHADEYQNEYPAPYSERLSWLTAFTGSAGFAIIGLETAHVFSDGRYTLQLKSQLDLDHFSPLDLVVTPPSKWLEDAIKSGQRVGLDTALHTIAEFERFEKAANNGGGELVSTKNLIDRIWEDQPDIPLEPVSVHDIRFAGKLARDKITELQEELKSKKTDFCLLADPTTLAWLFNIRGQDVAHTPLTLCRALVPAEGYPLLFIDKRKLPTSVEAYLKQIADLHPPNRMDEEIKSRVGGKTCQMDKNQVSALFHAHVVEAGGTPKFARDPLVIKRAVKNKAEIEGSRNAHKRDGVAVTKFLYWLEQQKPGSIDEITAAKRLEELRTETAASFQMPLKEISFDTISGAGPNGAIVHYRVTTETNATLQPDSLYLVDSGAQYEDGTTDITRTVAIGSPPEGAIEDFTLVLKGHIQLAMARFPRGTRGVDLDVLARSALWQNGKDYAHGTGHGIGSYLSVHEGPQSISKRGMEQLLAGMIISNEPGFYAEGRYGIRIENLVLVREATGMDGGTIDMHGFETLTLAPIDLRLVDPTRMTDDEIHWLNAYHGWVRRELSGHLNDEENAWLNNATRPISRELPAASA